MKDFFENIIFFYRKTCILLTHQEFFSQLGAHMNQANLELKIDLPTYNSINSSYG
jgi:hypothetical protein